MSNITEEIENKTELLYDFLYGDTPGKIVLYSNISLCSLIGPILMLGIVAFEMFGGDSQKRTIVNRLLSAILINISIVGSISGFIRVMRDVDGLIDFNLAMFLMLSCKFFKNAAIILYNVLTITRFLFIVVWKRMTGVHDKFWCYFICCAAYLLSLWFIIVLVSIGFHPNDDLLINLTKEDKENKTHDDENTFLNKRYL